VIKKQNPTVYCLGYSVEYKDNCKFKIKRWIKIYCASTNQRKTVAVILILNGRDLSIKKIFWDKEGPELTRVNNP
jgi:hypothetical protein